MDQIKINLATWNIFLGLRLKTILREIKSTSDFEKLTFLGIQEASCHHKQDDCLTLAKSLGENFKAYQIDQINPLGIKQSQGFIWNSQSLKVNNIEELTLPSLKDIKLSTREKWFFKIKSAHQRIALKVTAKYGQNKLAIYVVHLNLLGLNLKINQFDFILDDINKDKRQDLAIILGDFNLISLRKNLLREHIAKAIAKEEIKDLGIEIEWTHRIWAIKQKLDSIFVRSKVDYKYRCWAKNIPGSDHIPLFAELKF